MAINESDVIKVTEPLSEHCEVDKQDHICNNCYTDKGSCTLKE
ncbi:hypothetical protein vBAspATola_33 [Aeromonas phage vB_AspA_Tola]|nr:hypothetical protein vBAspATola_33 [Aeromonas phage vB_AspA_Tola]